MERLMVARRTLSTLGSIVLSLILAFIVWAGASSAQNPAVTDWYETPIPIKVINQADGSVIVTPMEAYAQVRITAPENQWESIRPTDFEAYIDLSQVNVGSMANVRVIVVALKSSIRLESYRPESVTLQLERYETREVPVRANIVDTPVLGYVTKPPLVSPDSVTIGGPASAVARVAYASVDVWLRGTRDSIERSLVPVPVDGDGAPVTNVSVVPPNVSVRVELAQRANFKPSVPIRVKLVGEVAPLYSLQSIVVRPASVTLVGLPEVLDEIPEFLETEPVDISGATATITRRVNLNLPPGVSVVPETADDDASQAVLVGIEVVPVVGSRTMQVTVAMQGLAPDLRATLSPETVDVYLSGPLAQLQALADEDIEATVNVLDLPPGNHRLVPTINVPPGLSITGILPEAVVVEITAPPPTADAGGG